MNESKELEVELLVYNNSGEPIENSLSPINFTESEGAIPRRGFRTIKINGRLNSFYKSKDVAFHKFKKTEIETLLPTNTIGSLSNTLTRKNIFCEPTYQHRLFEEIISERYIANKDSNRFRSLSCLNDEEIWICGENNILSLYNPQGKRVKTIPTKSGNCPIHITVTQNGDLVYTDSLDRTVNLVNDKGLHYRGGNLTRSLVAP